MAPTLRSGPLLADVVGEGPPVVLVHGVGLGPETFGDLAAELASGATVATVHRPGYGALGDPGRPPVPLADQVTALAGLVEDLGHGPAVLVGVSGGATLGLLVARDRPSVLRAAVLHEPLVGPLAPALHERLAARAAELAADGAPAAVDRFVAGLVGPATWSRLPEAWRHGVRRVGTAVRREVPDFARLAPAPEALAARRGRPPLLITTVGGSSGTARRQAAGVLVDLAGARAHTLAGIGHLAQVEAPAVLARRTRAVLAATARPTPVADGAEPTAVAGGSR